MLTDLIAEYAEKDPPVADLLRQLNNHLTNEEYDRAHETNQALVEKHGLTLAINAKGGSWEGATVHVVSVPDGRVPSLEDFHPATEVPPPTTSPPMRPSTPPAPTTYTTQPCALLFGRDGHGIYFGEELVAVAKSEDRANLIVALLEQAAGGEALKEWTLLYERGISDHGDHERAIKDADRQFTQRMAADAAQV